MRSAGKAVAGVRPLLHSGRAPDELWDSLAETYDAFARRLIALLNGYGLLLSEYRALRLCRSAYVPLSAITRALGVTPAATTDIARRLVSRGLARRVPNPSDRRSTLLTITPQGEAVYREARGRYRSYLGQLNASLSPQAREELERVLVELRKLLGQIEP
jgi:DNA-binding MarR family transcriptional regulator